MNNPARNWEEDYSHENGKYQNKCHECGELFFGHKRRPICKVCADKPPDWEKMAEKKPPTQHESWAWQGCWADGEMTGFAKCMVKKVKPLEQELADLRQQLKQEREEIERLKQAYDYIRSSRKSVDRELNEANKELNTLKSAKWIELQEIFHEQLKQKHDEGWNQAIDECIRVLENYPGDYK